MRSSHSIPCTKTARSASLSCDIFLLFSVAKWLSLSLSISVAVRLVCICLSLSPPPAVSTYLYLSLSVSVARCLCLLILTLCVSVFVPTHCSIDAVSCHAGVSDEPQSWSQTQPYVPSSNSGCSPNHAGGVENTRFCPDGKSPIQVSTGFITL